MILDVPHAGLGWGIETVYVKRRTLIKARPLFSLIQTYKWGTAQGRNGSGSMYMRPEPVRPPYSIRYGSFRYLPKLLLDLCMKCIQLLFDGILSLRWRLKLHL